MKKKLLSSILVICMVLSMLPVTAFAAEPDTHDHEFTVLVGTLKASTCTVKGIGQYKCKFCTETLYQALDFAHKAPATGVETKEPTCAEPGYKKYTCTECGEDIEEALSATGKHVYKESYTDETCSSPALSGSFCETCGKAEEGKTPTPVTGSVALGHHYVLDTKDDEYEPAACGKAGMDVYVCDREDCDEVAVDGRGKRYTAPSTALDHDWNEGVAVPATCEHPQGTMQTCKRDGCGETRVTPLQGGDPQLAHNWVTAKDIAVSCKTETDGRTGGQECSRCHTLGTGTDGNGGVAPTVTKWEHTPEDKVITIKEATCKETGSKRTDSVCTTCKKTLEEGTPEDIKKTEEHTKVLSGTPLRQATCSTPGIGQYECSVCGASLGYLSIDKLPHTRPTDASKVEIEPATCMEEGSAKYTCTVCKQAVTDTLKKLDHDYSDPVFIATINGKEVKLTAEQAAAYTCVVVTKTQTCQTEGCGDEKTESTDGDGEHTFEDILDESDCTKGILLTKECTVCGTRDGEGEPVFGTKQEKHILEEVKAESKAATCEAEGVKVEKCTYEGCKYKQTTTLPKIDHTWGMGEFLDPTCEENAGSVQVCTECGAEGVEKRFTDEEVEKFGDEYKKTGHDYTVPVPAVAATCTTAGSTAGFKCANCGEIDPDKAPKTIEALNHKGNTNQPVETITKPATCKEDGEKVTTTTCSLCHRVIEGETKTEPISSDPDAHVRKQVGTALKEMSCVNGTKGIAKFECEVCGKDLEYASVPVTHSYQEVAADGESAVVKKDAEYDTASSKPATCTTAGEYYYKCDICKKLSEKIEVKALGHDIPTTAERPAGKPDCVDCEVEVTCTRDGCNEKDTVTVAASGKHTYEDTTTPATCLKPATTGTICSKCKGVKDGTLPTTSGKALGHQWVLDATDSANKAATCAEFGVAVYKCSREGCDGDKTNPGREERTVKKLDHVWGNQVPVAANCEHGAGVSKTCQNCGETVVEEFTKESGLQVEKSGHSYKAVPDKTATCSEAGWTNKEVCDNCGAINTEKAGYQEIEATAHTPKAAARENEVAATCAAEGSYDEVIRCDVCNNVISSETKTIAKDPAKHTELVAASTPLRAATCTKNGIGKMHCNGCDKDVEGYQTIPALGHTKPANAVPTKSASCTEDGSITYTCSVCRTPGITEVLKATGHDFSGEPVYDHDYTCGDRTATYTCGNDGCDETKKVPVKGDGKHTYVVKTVEATCSAPAQFGYVCEDCGEAKGKLETVLGSEPTGHDFDETTPVTTDKRYKAATCDAGGNDVFKCKHCDATVEKASKALGHQYGTGTVIDPTCTDKWTYVLQICQRKDCGHEDKVKMYEADEYADHTLTKTPAKAHTCTEDGNIAYWTCSVCKKLYADKAGVADTTSAIQPSATVDAKDHDYDVVEVPATCKKAAHMLLTCKVCVEGTEGHTDEVFDPNDTALAPHVPNEAALTASAEYQAAACGDTVTFASFTCKNCGDTINSGASLEVKKEHTYGTSVITAATCQKPGSEVYTCSKCDESVDGHTKSKTIPQRDHTFPTTVEVPENWPACKPYEGRVACTTCKVDDGEVEYKDVTVKASKTHEYEENVIGEGDGYDCTKGIFAGSICKFCHEPETDENGDSIGNLVPGTQYEDHDWVPDEGEKIPDCVKGGTYKVHCSRCSATDTLTVDEGGTHKASGKVTTEEGDTCTAPTKVMDICSVCNTKYVVQEVPGIGQHTLDTAEIPATCTNAAMTVQYCSKCQAVNPTTGELTKGDKDATDASGNKVYQVLSGGEAKPNGAHKWSTVGEVTEPASCTEDGIRTFTCTVTGCDATRTEPILAAHDLEVEEIKATCAKGGYTIKTCKKCDYTHQTDPGEPDPNAHEFEFDLENGKILKQPTCTKTGIGEGTCKHCGTTATAVMPALGHDLETVTVAATCQSAGSTTTTCSRGDLEPEVKEISIADHNFVVGRGGVERCTMCRQTRDDIANPAVMEAFVEEMPVEENPVVETPSEDDPAVETPSEDDPAVETPSEDDPAVETPSEDDPAVETPSEDDPVVETPSEDDPVVETPSEDDPAVETPSEDDPVEETPSEDAPVEDAPSADEAAAE